MAPRMSVIDPYRMAQFAVDEAVRNVVTAGGDPYTLCLLDNFCWPDPVASQKNLDGAYKLGQLVLTCEGLYDICKAYGAPLVSGKDSMKNDFRGKDARGQEINISCLPTLMVTAMAKVTMGSSVGSGFRAAGDHVYMLGGTGAGLAASEYAELFEASADHGPAIDMAANLALYRRFHAALKAGLIRSAHDVSEGGMLVAAAESAIGGRLGVALALEGADALFNEAPGRIVVSVAPDHQSAFEKALPGAQLVGQVLAKEIIAVDGHTIPLNEIVVAWKKGF
jgi:phosphoribosylformylglycinamidine synthase subunit PurSL